MRQARWTVIGSFLGACVLAGAVGCSEYSEAPTGKGATDACLGNLRPMPAGLEAETGLAHGGTATVNDAAADAMFFKHYGTNPFIDTDEDRLSTFAVDVDTGSYTLTRSYLEGGHLPDPAAVRVEEFVNYFDYGYAPPADEDMPFAVHLAAGPSAFGDGKTLLRVGLKAREIRAEHRKRAVLTFVIDVSGSMAREDRLGLVKESLRLLVNELREGDAVGIAVYGSRGEILLRHTGVERRGAILEAVEALEPAGSTNAEEGLRIAYRMARAAFEPGAVNRVVLCSDGVANVGRTGPDAILREIRRETERGITLSAIGFGMGNYNDVLMEQLGDKGDGHYAYVDTLAEARRVFVENLTGTLQVVARDVKVQVEFDPEVVRSYRLLGYENRDVADEDFRDDRVDGGEIGAGHSVTALYELKLWSRREGRLATVRVRSLDPETREPREVEAAIGTADTAADFAETDGTVQLAACAAEFAEILRESHWARDGDLGRVLDLARRAALDYDRRADVEELVRLVATAERLSSAQARAWE